MKTFSDIFKKSFLEGTGTLTVNGFILSLLTAFLCGMIVYIVYRKFYRGVIYNNNFNILLVMTSLVTCFMVIVISSNVVLSLGMVGALSIVRYRAAVKDPLDVGFLFWSVAIGITSGAGLYLISAVATVFIAVIYILLIKVRSRKHQYLLLVKCHASALKNVEGKLSAVNKILKNKTVIKDHMELTYEIDLPEESAGFVEEVSEIKGVSSAVLVEFSGDYVE